MGHEKKNGKLLMPDASPRKRPDDEELKTRRRPAPTREELRELCFLLGSPRLRAR
jgi:hypothetical protein